MFWTKQQNLIYLDVIKAKQNIYVPVEWIDMEHLRKNQAYFGEPLDLVEQFGIEEIITFHLDFDPELVAQFFASVHFHTDEKRTMTWMTNGKRMSAEWKEFMDMLNIRDEGLDVPVGACPHANPESANKNKLQPFLVEKTLPSGKKSFVLNPFLDIMHKIFRNSLFPCIGDKDKVHSYIMGMMLMCEEVRRHEAEPLDVSHIMWSELQFAMFHWKLPIYGPYLFLLISKTWDKLFLDEEFVAPNWIRHEPIKLRIKSKWANTTTRAEAEAARMDVDEDEFEEEEAAEDSSEGYAPPSAEPSWAKKLKAKMKALFCMQAKGQYKAHVNAKMARRRDKAIMRQVGLEVADGSEEQITDEEAWTKQQCSWS